MSYLTRNEKTILEKFLEMDGDTVLDFTNRFEWIKQILLNSIIPMGI
jgi:hypothetical protein